MTDLKKDIKEQMEKDIQETMNIYETDLKVIKNELQHQKQKVKIMSDLLQQSYQVQHDLSKRLDAMDLNNAKRSAILSGLDFSEKKKDRSEQIESFLLDTLELDINIEDSYFLGDKTPRPTVIVFANSGDKMKVWERKKMLKDYIGKNDQGIYLNDYLPQIVSEKRRRERDIITEIKESGAGISTEYTKDGLKIGACLYKKQITTPSPSDLLELSPKEFEDVMNVKTVKGDKIVIEDSVFVGYSLDADNLGQVRKAYLKIKTLNAQARHIICAYNLPGVEKYHLSDYVDDDEPGAGRAVLSMMKENNIINKVFYIARFCGKRKLGS